MSATALRRAVLGLALGALALPLGGCTTSTYCGVPVLEFLFCDPRGGEPSYGSFDTAQPPVAGFRVEPDPPTAGVAVTLVSTAHDPDGFLPGVQSIRSSEWDLDGDGDFDARTEPDWTTDGFRDQTTHTFPAAGTYGVRLRVFDWDGLSGEVVRQVTVRSSGPVSEQPGEAPSSERPGAGSSARRRPPHAFLAQLRLGRISAPRGARRRARRGALRGVRVRGQLTGSVLPDSPPTGPALPRPPRALARLLAAPVTARLEIATDRRRTRQGIRGVAVARLPGSPRGSVCFALRLVNVRGRQPAGSFRILGGTGAGRALRGSGRVRGALRAPDLVSFGGTAAASARRSGALPAACRAVRGR